MEVQGRAVLSRTRLSETALARSGGRIMTAAAGVVAVGLAVVAVAAQPLDSPWWTYADADAAYTGSSLNLLLGQQVRYLDHPGLPLEEVGAVAFGADYLVRRLAGRTGSRLEYVDATMLDLDRARPFFRSLAILFYLLGALLSFVLLTRLFGHWIWGLAGSLFWVSAPGLLSMSIQFRPDVPLAVLCLAFAYLVARAVDTRSAWSYAAAGAVLGLAVMTKLHSAGLLPALALAVVWRPPEDGLRARERLRGLRPRTRALLAGGLALWLVLAIVLNLDRWPFRPASNQLVLLLGPPLAVAAFLLVSRLARRTTGSRVVRRVFHPGYAIAAGGFLVGLYAPLTLDVPDGLQSLVNVVNGVTGRGINEGIERFTTPFSLLTNQLRTPFALFVLAGVAAVVGLVRREPVPVVWFVGATVLGVMAMARLAAFHYFAPAYVLSVLGALWLLWRLPRQVGALLALPVALYVSWATLRDLDGPKREAERFAAVVAPSKRAVEGLLQPSEVALVPSYWPFEDSRYYELVQLYVNHTPDYPYRFLPATYSAAEYAAERGWRLRYYIGPEVQSLDQDTLFLGDVEEFGVRRVPGTDIAAELVSGPGADRPWTQPEAIYDPETGYYKDPGGRYYDRKGDEVPDPPKRRRIDGLWVDAYGDFWDEEGRLVKSDPSLRTVP